MPNSDKTTAGPEMCQECARDITDTFVTAMYTVHSDHNLGTDLFRIEIYADQMCHVNAASVSVRPSHRIILSSRKR